MLFDWTIARKSYLSYLKDKSYLSEQMLSECRNSKLAMAEENIILKRESQKRKKELSVNDAQYWNNRWAKNDIFYYAPSRKEVREYVRYFRSDAISALADILIRDFSLSSGADDLVPFAVLRWLDNQFKEGKFTYTLDKGEQWENPDETLNKAYNDCDGWAIVEHFLIREIFKKQGRWELVKHRLKCVVGHVHLSDQLNQYAGLHFYLNWLHGVGEWMTVESTFYRERAIMNYGSKPQKLNPQYGLIAFTFNEENTWIQKSIEISSLDYKKNGD